MRMESPVRPDEIDLHEDVVPAFATPEVVTGYQHNRIVVWCNSRWGNVTVVAETFSTN